MMLKEKLPVSARHVINMTPLIDIIFLLVLFFLLSTSFVTIEAVPLSITSLTSDLPENSSPNDAIITLRIEGDGLFTLNDTKMDSSSVMRLLRQKKNPTMVVMASEAATVQQLVRTFDLLQTLEIHSISVANSVR